MGTRWPTIGRPNCRTIDRLISFGDTHLYTYSIGMYTLLWTVCTGRHGVSLLYVFYAVLYYYYENLLYCLFIIIVSSGKEKRVIFYRFRSDVCFLLSYRARPNLSRPPDDSPPPRPAVSVFHTRVMSFLFGSPSDSEPVRHKAHRRGIQKRNCTCIIVF